MSSRRAPSQRRASASPSASSQPAASEPVLGEENVDVYIEVPDVIGGQEGDCILQLQSESMGSAGFLGGDYVVVRPTHDPDSGAIVVVTAGEKVTLMRVCRDGDQLRLLR